MIILNKIAIILVCMALALHTNCSLAEKGMQDKSQVMNQAITDYISSRFLSATFSFANNERILVAGAKGIFSIEDGTQLKLNQKMPIASGTQEIVAAAILRLFDNKLLSLDDKVSKFLNSIWHDEVVPKWAKQVSIHHLLTHTSGIKEYYANVIVDNNLALYDNNLSIVNFVSKYPLSFKPGTKYNYCNTNYVILGMIIEKISGKSLANFLKDEFFVPLGMNNSYLIPYEEYLKAVNDNQTSLYPERYTASLNDTKKPTLLPADSEIYFSPNADGGIISTAKDLIIWYRALHNHKILSKKAYELMVTKHIALKESNNMKSYAGYGVNITKLQKVVDIIHNPGLYNNVVTSGYLPNEGIYFAVLSNVYVKPVIDDKAINMRKIENQIDIGYFRDNILQAILGINS